MKNNLPFREKIGFYLDEKFPEWLRWLLFIPISWIVFLFTTIVGFFLAKMIFWVETNVIGARWAFMAHIADTFLLSFLVGYIPVRVGANFVPRKKLLASIILTVFFGVEFYFLVLDKINEADTVFKYIIAIASGLVMIGGSVAACYSFKNEID